MGSIEKFVGRHTTTISRERNQICECQIAMMVLDPFPNYQHGCYCMYTLHANTNIKKKKKLFIVLSSSQVIYLIICIKINNPLIKERIKVGENY